jgi:hypothetical protein
VQALACLLTWGVVLIVSRAASSASVPVGDLPAGRGRGPQALEVDVA